MALYGKSAYFQAATNAAALSYLPNGPTVGVPTIPAPATPALEYVSALAENSGGGGTVGTYNFAPQGSRNVTMSDGTVFSLVLSNDATSKLYRQAPGGYGVSSHTLVTSRAEQRDLNTHILRNAVFDQVHLIYCNSSTTYAVATYSSAGVLVDDTTVTTGGSDAWFADGGSTRYSAAGISPNGTICLTNSVSVPATVDGITTSSSIDAAKRIQKMRWDGASWTFGAIGTVYEGRRIVYEYVFVDPPGREGWVVGVGRFDVSTKPLNQQYNPYYRTTWTNNDSGAHTSFTFTGLVTWRARYDNIRNTYERQIMVHPIWRQTDLPSTSPTANQRGDFSIFGCTMDKFGRIWASIWQEDPVGATTNRLVTLHDWRGVELKRVDLGGSQGHGSFLEKSDGTMYHRWLYTFATPYTHRIRLITEGASSLSLQSVAAGVNQDLTAIGANLDTGYAMAQETRFTAADRRGGSVLANNQHSVWEAVYGDFTGGAAPGTTPPSTTGDPISVKRVVVQLP